MTQPAPWSPGRTLGFSPNSRAALTRAGLDGERVLVSAFGSYELRLPPGTEVDVDAASVYLEDAGAALRAARPGEALAAAADTAANLARRPFLPGDDGPWIEHKRSELCAILVRALEIGRSCFGPGTTDTR